jgi:hypothetical protein
MEIVTCMTNLRWFHRNQLKLLLSVLWYGYERARPFEFFLFALTLEGVGLVKGFLLKSSFPKARSGS